MWIITDEGTEAVNTENVVTISVVRTDQGPHSIVAYAAGVALQTFLCVNTKAKCDEALPRILKAVRERQHVLDMRDVTGQRPSIQAVQPEIILPGNGEGGRP